MKVASKILEHPPQNSSTPLPPTLSESFTNQSFYIPIVALDVKISNK